MSSLATVVSTVAPFATAIGTGMQYAGAIQQGRAAQTAATYNATVDQQNAQIATQDAWLQAQQQDRINRQNIGAIQAANGASGLTPASSVFDVLGDAAAQGELQKQDIIYQGQLQARGYNNTAQLDLLQGRNAQTRSQMQAGTDLLSGTVNTLQQFSRLS